MNLPNLADMMTEEQAAKALNVRPRTLAKWRSIKKGPPFYKVGRGALYSTEDLNRWLLNQRVAS